MAEPVGEVYGVPIRAVSSTVDNGFNLRVAFDEFFLGQSVHDIPPEHRYGPRGDPPDIHIDRYFVPRHVPVDNRLARIGRGHLLNDKGAFPDFRVLAALGIRVEYEVVVYRAERKRQPPVELPLELPRDYMVEMDK